VSEARRNRSDGNFDGTNSANGEYFLEEIHRKIVIRNVKSMWDIFSVDTINLPSDTRLINPQSAICFGYVMRSSGRVQLCYNVQL